MAPFHQQSRGEELKGVSPSESTDVISGHDHCIQAQPEAGNQEAETSRHKIEGFKQVQRLTSHARSTSRHVSRTGGSLKMDRLSLQRSHEEVSHRFSALQLQVNQNHEAFQMKTQQAKHINTQERQEWNVPNAEFRRDMSCFTDRDDTDDGKTE
ncbi:hypothetical protein IRJ41_023887 [Triplophysa rosa]|uniref:Uncharacterized protein n=1 Tax=Triplophysa rosa TaxID=992332 RepID=A0A9W7WXN0_TRIRA|nr:hypothetical protein IRJ41_023887 [Triplophysa rosa]